MVKLALKHYQDAALKRLGSYLEQTRLLKDARTAFVLETNQPWFDAPDLEGLPYVCLRVPTGGGKTLMACGAVGIATKSLLGNDRSVVLWLVPSNQIKEQTLKALRQPGHPYREALEDGLAGGSVAVLELQEALSVSRSTLDGETVVIVSTLAAPRVKETDERKIYEPAGALMAHFQGLSREEESVLEQDEAGKPLPHLANVLRLHNPIVIMDEAHNARTQLAFKTLARFAPSCILEFTATPQRHQSPEKHEYASNVLVEVTASELKAEHMIKLPIHLETRQLWETTVREAIAKRDELEVLAEEEAASSEERLRPIVLLQAQPRNAKHETVTVEVLRDFLLKQGIPEEQIRRATGEDREIADEDLLAPGCEVRYIITVQALREGWDCPLAYVLCSVAELGAPTAVEQILGRLMRLPGARERQHQALNEAYAFVASRAFDATARQLVDGLVQNGFDPLEARRAVDSPLFVDTGLFGLPTDTPASRGDVFRVPQLAVRQGSMLEVWEQEDYLPEEWALADCEAVLTEEEFRIEERVRRGFVDVRGRKLGIIPLSEVEENQLSLLGRQKPYTQDELVVWLDRETRQQDITQAHNQVFLHNLVKYLCEQRKLSPADLSREKYRLREAVLGRIKRYRTEAKQTGQREMFDKPEQVEVSPERCFEYSRTEYPIAPEDCGFQFAKHYYGSPGKLDKEELACAVHIEQGGKTRFWVRNPVHSRCGFSLPTTSDRFYPDFVVELVDGRHLVVEYKGAHLRTAVDAQEKELLGRLWATRSEGRCLFEMIGKSDLGKLSQILS